MLCLGWFVIVGTLFLTGTTFDNRFLLLSFLAGAITASFYGWLPLYLPELFPTRVRATGQGFGFNFGRIIAAIGVLQLSSLKDLVKPHGWGQAEVFTMLSAVYLIGIHNPKSDKPPCFERGFSIKRFRPLDEVQGRATEKEAEDKYAREEITLPN